MAEHANRHAACAQKAGEDGIGTGFRTYAQDPRQERQGPSLPLPQQRPMEGWREDSGAARWQGPPAEVSSASAVAACRCCMKVWMVFIAVKVKMGHRWCGWGSVPLWQSRASLL